MRYFVKMNKYDFLEVCESGDLATVKECVDEVDVNVREDGSGCSGLMLSINDNHKGLRR